MKWMRNRFPTKELYAESLKRLDNLTQHRRLRIFAGNNAVPPVIWLVLLVAGAITVSYALFFGMENIKAQYMITAALTVTITLILFLIYFLDHPFTGTSKVSAEPLKTSDGDSAETVKASPVFTNRRDLAKSPSLSAVWESVTEVWLGLTE